MTSTKAKLTKTRGKAKSTIIFENAVLEIVAERAPITVRGVAYGRADSIAPMSRRAGGRGPWRGLANHIGGRGALFDSFSYKNIEWLVAGRQKWPISKAFGRYAREDGSLLT